MNIKGSYRNKYNKKFSLFFSIILIYIIFIIVLLTISITNGHFLKRKNNESKSEMINSVLSIDNNEVTNKFKNIMYKGEKVNMSELIENYTSLISFSSNKEKKEEIVRCYKYLSLDELPDNPYFIPEIKMKLLNEISKETGKVIKQLDTIFITKNGNFGRSLIALNNIIFYCEILSCKNIILNENDISPQKWYIKNDIFLEKNNITIMLGPEPDCNNDTVVCTVLDNYFFYPMVIKTQIRFNLLKNEIIKNLPKYEANPNDLFIHIRSGNIFSNFIHSSYAQPPLCFYEKIINDFKFDNIYIIAENKENKIIDKLIKKYTNIIHRKNKIDVDISYLLYGYNIVASISSFLISIIKFNDNLQNLWEYDLMKLPEKVYNIHFHIFNFPIKYKLYTMIPSNNYRNQMFFWKNSGKQSELMLEEKCPQNFIITLPNN